MPYSRRSRAAAAIVASHETGRPLGDYSAVAVLSDGAGISYGTGISLSFRFWIVKYMTWIFFGSVRNAASKRIWRRVSEEIRGRKQAIVLTVKSALILLGLLGKPLILQNGKSTETIESLNIAWRFGNIELKIKTKFVSLLAFECANIAQTTQKDLDDTKKRDTRSTKKKGMQLTVRTRKLISKLGLSRITNGAQRFENLARLAKMNGQLSKPFTLSPASAASGASLKSNSRLTTSFRLLIMARTKRITSNLYVLSATFIKVFSTLTIGRSSCHVF